jgi:hypothetical protein
MADLVSLSTLVGIHSSERVTQTELAYFNRSNIARAFNIHADRLPKTQPVHIAMASQCYTDFYNKDDTAAQSLRGLHSNGLLSGQPLYW